MFVPHDIYMHTAAAYYHYIIKGDGVGDMLRYWELQQFSYYMALFKLLVPVTDS